MENEQSLDGLTKMYCQAQILIAEINKKSPEPILIHNEKSLSNTCVALVHESCELQNLTNWKWWKKPKSFDHDFAVEETIDLLHFILQLCIILNLKPEQIVREFEKKHKINMERQRNYY